MDELMKLMHELLYIHLFGMDREAMNAIAKTHRNYCMWDESNVDECINDCLSFDALQATTEVVNILIPLLQAKGHMGLLEGAIWLKGAILKTSQDALKKRGIAKGDYLYAWDDSGFPKVDKSIPTNQTSFLDLLDSND